MSKLTASIFAAIVAIAAVAADITPLPAPQREGGEAFFTVLGRRRSQRRFTDAPLSAEQLSTLLWAGFGESGTGGKRTAPTAANRQEFTLYAVLADGAYKYLPKTNELEKITGEDLRPLAAGNVKAPAYILIVADLKRAASSEYAAIDAGYISQNLYLAADALKLGSCALGSFRRDKEKVAKLAAELKFGPNDKAFLSHAVGNVK